MGEKLKPCPFCGGQPTFCMCGAEPGDNHPGCHLIECACGMQFDWLPLSNAETLDELRTEMASAWNRRERDDG